MMKQAFLHYTYITESCIALFSFAAVFIGAFLWVNRRGSKEIYEKISGIPLRDDEEALNHE